MTVMPSIADWSVAVFTRLLGCTALPNVDSFFAGEASKRGLFCETCCEPAGLFVGEVWVLAAAAAAAGLLSRGLSLTAISWEAGLLGLSETLSVCVPLSLVLTALATGADAFFTGAATSQLRFPSSMTKKPFVSISSF